MGMCNFRNLNSVSMVQDIATVVHFGEFGNKNNL